MARKKGASIGLPAIEDLFTSQEERDRALSDEVWIGNTYLDGFDRISPAFLNSTGLM